MLLNNDKFNQAIELNKNYTEQHFAIKAYINEKSLNLFKFFN